MCSKSEHPGRDHEHCRTRPADDRRRYLDSPRDDREVYIYGERVKDVTTHPAFRNTARMTARLYDALHDDKRKSKLLLPTDTGNGGMTHAFFKAPQTPEDLVAGRDAIAEWARITYGWMGRSPDYKAAFLATLGANADFYDPYQDNARHWYKFAQERVPFINHAIIHPPVIATDRPTRSATSACMSRRRPTPAHRVGRQGGGDGLGADQLHVRRASRADPAQNKSFACVFMLPSNAKGRQIPLPHLL